MPNSSQPKNMVKAVLFKRFHEAHPKESPQLLNIAVHSQYSLERRRYKEKSDSTRYHDKELYSARCHASFHGRRVVDKQLSLHQGFMLEITADNMFDLQSVMMFRNKRPLWQTPTKTVAFAVLD